MLLCWITQMHFHWGVHVCTLNRFTVKKSEKGPHACCGYAAKRYTRRGAAHLAPCGPRRPPQHTPCPHTCRGPLCPLGRCASHSCRRRARATSRRNRALLRARLSAPYPSRSCLAAAPRRLERDRESFSLDFVGRAASGVRLLVYYRASGLTLNTDFRNSVSPISSV